MSAANGNPFHATSSTIRNTFGSRIEHHDRSIRPRSLRCRWGRAAANAKRPKPLQKELELAPTVANELHVTLVKAGLLTESVFRRSVS
jgi:hypothetical protein